jgi:hypothetical protein
VKIKYLLLTLAFIPTAAPANDDILKSVFNGPGPSVDASLWNNHYVEQVPSNICGATLPRSPADNSVYRALPLHGRS